MKPFFITSFTVTIVSAQILTQPLASYQRFGYVTVNGTRFLRNGEPYYVAGANYWQGMNLASDFSWGGNRTRLETELAHLQSIGINNLRIMAASEGPDDQPFRMRPSLMPSPGIYNQHILDGLDYLLDALDKHSMTAVVTLNNYWHWSGGFAQYVSWADNDSDIPYPPSWIPDPVNNYSSGSYDEFYDYAYRFYDDDTISSKTNQLFRNHINAIMMRRNTINGKLYNEDPVIMAWEIANEPQLAPKKWTTEIAKFIRQRSPYQLVTAGIEGKYGFEDFWNTHSSPEIDYTTCHLWVENWGIYNASDSSPSNLDSALDYADSFISNCSGWAVGMGKPMVLEEFGMARDAWRDPSFPLYKYNPGTATTNKDTYYRHIFRLIQKLASHGASAGANFWAYSGEGYPSDASNSFDMVWIGDPQHEPRGWYGVYHNDTTVSVIKEFAKSIVNG
ncbi:glycoside hydrolase superfamily [Umbelopsis sp. AD052]|nr:glycoside hydrolase superfamily [Umbelopsis sp. AD052]